MAAQPPLAAGAQAAIEGTGGVLGPQAMPAPGETAECSFLTDSTLSPTPPRAPAKRGAASYAPYGGGCSASAKGGPTGWPAPLFAYRKTKANAEAPENEADEMREAIERIGRRVLEQDRQLGKWAKWHHDNAQRIDSLEGMVRAGVNEGKAHISIKMQDLEGRVHGRIDTVERYWSSTESRLRSTVYI